ncbi:hypothetical protein C9I57_19430 [Trinickia symbiotica]|uniref:Uncharacterized protein n=1 Tax=Trinickia symbiotica TaxID=863227 RepID=A0A2T3XRP0_9BURK|nr:hypothetical protein C9I57_19430 [Trinickia symbiotica]
MTAVSKHHAGSATQDDPRVRCAACGHWSSVRSSLETAIPGLASLGSAFGASAADTRLCRRHDRLTSPRDGCRSFISRSSAAID